MNLQMYSRLRLKNHTTGFTIVELAVVIVIIGILAGLVVTSFGSWQRSLAEKEVRSELIAASAAMKSQRNFSAGYPPEIPTSYKQGSRVEVTYYSEGSSSSAFCLDGYSKSLNNITLFVREDGVVKRGTCAGGEIPDFLPNGALMATAISAGLNNGCAISGGKPYCWGNNGQGQLGNNTVSSTANTKPVAVDVGGVLSGKTVTAISSGYGHNCAIAGGEAYCWGHNGSGQLGNNSTTNSSVPVAVNTSGVLSGKTVTQIAAGRNFTCVIASGLPYCWGENIYRQLGNNTTTSSSVPVAVITSGVLSGRTITQIDVGVEHACVVASSAAYCWGENYDGRLGNNSTTPSAVPVAVNTAGVLSGRTVTQIDAGHYTTCVTATGQAYCWGRNDYGQLGNNTISTTPTLVPVAVSTTGVLSGKTVTSVSFAVQAACALANGQAYCWGRNDSGNLGDGTYDAKAVPVAVSTSGVLNGKTLTSVVSGANFACGLSSGSVYCWGINNWGQLGDNSTSYRPTPVKVSNP